MFFFFLCLILFHSSLKNLFKFRAEVILLKSIFFPELIEEKLLNFCFLLGGNCWCFWMVNLDCEVTVNRKIGFWSGGMRILMKFRVKIVNFNLI